MKDFFILKLLDLFRRVFIVAGIDYPVLRRILQVKLTMDQRRKPTIFQQQGKKKKHKEDENQFYKSLIFYAIMGLILLPFLFLKENYLFQVSTMVGIFMFIIMTSLISDFSSVLLDIRDKSVLSTKPITDKTISIAKTLHICIYITYISVAVSAIPLIVSIFVQGIIFFLLFVFTLMWVNMLVISVTALFYLVILRFFDGEKLKDIINYAQIVLSMAVFIGYQLVARSFELVTIDIVMKPEWWQLLIPPIWFGSMFDTVLNGEISLLHMSYTVLAIIGPIVSLMIYYRFIPVFEHQLQKLANHSSNSKGKKRRKNFGILKLFLKSHEERTFFRFASKMIRNEREFKLKVYPSLGFAIVIPFIFMLNTITGDESWESVFTGKSYMTIYGSFLVIPSSVLMLQYSGTYKGAWIYNTTPITSFVPLYKGALKAFMFQLFLPIFGFLAVLFAILFGPHIVIHLLIALVSAALYTVICFKLNNEVAPFTESFSSMEQSEGWKVFLHILFIPLFVGLHFLSQLIPFGEYGYCFVLIFINWLSWKSIK